MNRQISFERLSEIGDHYAFLVVATKGKAKVYSSVFHLSKSLFPILPQHPDAINMLGALVLDWALKNDVDFDKPKFHKEAQKFTTQGPASFLKLMKEEEDESEMGMLLRTPKGGMYDLETMAIPKEPEGGKILDFPRAKK